MSASTSRVPARHALGEPVKLTPTEYALLRLLAQHAGRVLTHRQILKQVWGPQHTDETHYLRVYFAQLRQKFGVRPGAATAHNHRARCWLSPGRRAVTECFRHTTPGKVWSGRMKEYGSKSARPRCAAEPASRKMKQDSSVANSKSFFGMAAGVGKTYAMLQAGRDAPQRRGRCGRRLRRNPWTRRN